MSQSYEYEAEQQLRCACTNVIGFWQLLQTEHTISGKPICPIKRMEWRAYMVVSALKIADLIVEHHKVIAWCFPKNPARIEDFKETAIRMKLLALMADNVDLDEFDEEIGQFAWSFLGSMNNG